MLVRIKQNRFLCDQFKVFLVLIAVLLVLSCLAGNIRKERAFKKGITLEKFLYTAFQPVGSTMYIWGGGWNDEDDDAGAGSTRIGLSPQWKKFTNEQNSDYDYKKHRYERKNGLDCSGYVGWVIYNTFEQKAGQTGYVTRSTDLAKSLADRGWGELILNPEVFLPGDVVSMEGHVWICLGTCKDGSVLLVHSSPPGVSVCGTPSLERKGESIAILLATQYMKDFHPQWQEKYPNRTVATSYLENVFVFRWNTSILRDAEAIQSMGAEEIMDRMGGKHEIP